MEVTRIPAVGLAVVAGLCALSWGCSREKVSANNVDPAKVKVEEVPDLNVIDVEHPEQYKLATVEQRAVRDELNVTGSIAPDVARTVPVVSLTGGRVVEIHARLGDDVKKGQLLLTIGSPDVSAAFSDYQKFKADEALSLKQLERAQLLYDKGALAQKDLQVAEDTEEKAKVDVSTAAERIRILGADIDHPSSLIEVHAPVSGTIVEQNISSGTGVKSLDNSPNLFTIADLSKVWVLCDVFENDLAKVHLGDSAQVRLNAYPERAFRGKVSNIGRVLDANTRAAKVRLELDNPGGIMRANMFANVTFVSPSNKVRPVIPATAVLRLHDKTWVFVPDGGKRFRRREIQTGAMDQGAQDVTAGLSPGDKVVANVLPLATVADNR